MKIITFDYNLLTWKSSNVTDNEVFKADMFPGTWIIIIEGLTFAWMREFDITTGFQSTTTVSGSFELFQIQDQSLLKYSLGYSDLTRYSHRGLLVNRHLLTVTNEVTFNITTQSTVSTCGRMISSIIYTNALKGRPLLASKQSRPLSLQLQWYNLQRQRLLLWQLPLLP